VDLTNSKGKAAAVLGATALLSDISTPKLKAEVASRLEPAVVTNQIVSVSPQIEGFRYEGATLPKSWPKGEHQVDAPPPPPLKEEHLVRKVVVSTLSALFALGGYISCIHRGTPKERRQESLLTRACESLFPETPYFPNNRASWLMSTLNSSSLFLLGVLTATQAGQSTTSGILSMAVVGIYALGAGWLFANGQKFGSKVEIHPTDKKCLVGGLIGLGIFVYSGLAHLGRVPAINAPLELIGIGVGLATRSFAIYPLFREFRAAVSHARAHSELGVKVEGKDRPLPSLGAQLFWNAAIWLNLLNLENFHSISAIVPVGMTIQNFVLVTTGLWAHYQVKKLHSRG